MDIAQYEGTINQAVSVSGITDVQFMELPIEHTDNHGGKNTATMTIGRMTVTIDESISDSFLQRIRRQVPMFRDGTGFKRIYIACGYTDLRYGVDGFASIIQNHYSLNPFDKGTLFLFLRKTQ